MEPIEKICYEAKFENAFLKAKGNAFQTFFNELMERAYKSDYMPCRPWGKRGDRKNDGFLKSERRLFQVYAPNEMTEKKAIDKIDEDFEVQRANGVNTLTNGHSFTTPMTEFRLMYRKKC